MNETPDKPVEPAAPAPDTTSPLEESESNPDVEQEEGQKYDGGEIPDTSSAPDADE